MRHRHATIERRRERVVRDPAPDPDRDNTLIGVLIEAAQQGHAGAGVHGCTDVIVPAAGDAAKASGVQCSDKAATGGLVRIEHTEALAIFQQFRQPRLEERHVAVLRDLFDGHVAEPTDVDAHSVGRAM